MDTNNLVERWHRNLKHNYLEGKRNLRADDLVYILLGVVDNQFRTNYFKVVSGLQPHQLTTYEKKRRERAARIGLERAKTMINIAQFARGVISVQSFEIPVVNQYLVEVLADKWLRSCSCPDNQQQQITCKHMFLVSRVHPQLQVRFVNNITDLVETVDEETVNEDDFGPPIEDFLSPNLVEQLLAAREDEEQRLQTMQREEDREKRRQREEQKAQVMRECEESFRKAWMELGTVLHNGKARKCTETYFVSATALLEQAVREIKGIVQEKAGHRCQ